MAAGGPLQPIPESNAGQKGVVQSGEHLDRMIARLNAIIGAGINPPDSGAFFSATRDQFILDLTSLVSRISNIEARLDGASAHVNCVGNVATVTFNI